MTELKLICLFAYLFIAIFAIIKAVDEQNKSAASGWLSGLLWGLYILRDL